MKNKINKAIIDLIIEIKSDITIEQINLNESLSINSIEYIQLIVMIEENYGIIFDDDKLNIENLDTINKITDYVLEKIVEG